MDKILFGITIPSPFGLAEVVYNKTTQVVSDFFKNFELPKISTTKVRIYSALVIAGLLNFVMLPVSGQIGGVYLNITGSDDNYTDPGYLIRALQNFSFLLLNKTLTNYSCSEIVHEKIVPPMLSYYSVACRPCDRCPPCDINLLDYIITDGRTPPWLFFRVEGCNFNATELQKECPYFNIVGYSYYKLDMPQVLESNTTEISIPMVSPQFRTIK